MPKVVRKRKQPPQETQQKELVKKEKKKKKLCEDSSDCETEYDSQELVENKEGLLELRPRKKKTKDQLQRLNNSRQSEKKNQKVFFEEMFHNIVQFVHKVFGRNVHQGTDNVELYKFCSEQFGEKFKGVFSANQVPHDLTELKQGYYIVNTDPFHMPGTHWTAIADGLFYDSFDRKSTKLFPYIDLPTTSHNRVTEQKTSESNCGERCVAFLVIFHNFGPGTAKKYL